MIVFIILLKSECHEENEKTCMEQHGANSCKKVNGVDTCFCGDSRECDPHKRKKLCLNGQGKKIKDDVEAKCRKGNCKYFSRNSTCQYIYRVQFVQSCW